MHSYVRHAPWRELRQVFFVGLLRFLKLIEGFFLSWREDIDLRDWFGQRLWKGVADDGLYLLICNFVEIE